MNDPKRYVLDVQYNAETDEHYIQLPEDVTQSLDWKEGDVLKWDVKEDGTIILSKKSDG